MQKNNKETAENPEQSRSVRRTKTALRNSMMELMKTRSILRISVKEICDAADVGRTTFYAHYEDQYDLLKQIEDETLAYFENMLNRYKNKQNKKDIYQMLEEMLTYIANNGTTIQGLLSENGDIGFQKKLLYHFIMHKQVIKYFSEKHLSEETKAYYSVFVIHGAIGLIQHWLKGNLTTPVPQLVKIMMKWTEDLIKV
jgi:AcrR family transcriptional regulator